MYVSEKKENASEPSEKKEKKSGTLEDRVRPNLSLLFERKFAHRIFASLSPFVYSVRRK